MTPSAFIQYVVLEQLDAFAIDGVARALGAFANIETEAENYAQRMFESYGQRVGEADPGDFAETARDQG